MKYGNLNFLEPSGSLQVCNWTALPLFFSECGEGGSSSSIIVYLPTKIPIKYLYLNYTNYAKVSHLGIGPVRGWDLMVL